MKLLAVYEGKTRRASALGGMLKAALLGGALLLGSGLAGAAGGDLVLDAKEALRVKNATRLAALNAAAQAQQHPLAPWVDYWDIGLRLDKASQSDLEAFYARWPGSYVEDRLRNDWLLELGRRRDWKNFALDYPRFRMNDDREVSCYWLLTRHLDGQEVQGAALDAWLAQRDGDDGCQLLASTLHAAKKLGDADIWLKLRLATELNKPRAMRGSADLLGHAAERGVEEILKNPARYLGRHASAGNRRDAELTTLALIRVAASDPATGAELLNSRWERQLPADLAAWAWAQVARNSALRLQPEAADQFERALKLQGKAVPAWSDDTLAWAARAALRADGGAGRPRLLLGATEMMSTAERQETSWQYWRARALLAGAPEGAAGEAQRQQARATLQGLASPLSFYGKLAAAELGQQPQLPAPPAVLSAEEKRQAGSHPGLDRALRLIELGLRSEGVREWNFSLRGMADRELLAAAQLACDHEVWDRCINTSERTRGEVDLAQRFPMPFRKELVAKADEIGLDPAYVYGLIRQESRFIMDARSGVGASGLMQVMPATARWTAKKMGVDYRPEMLTDRDFNLRIGTNYLKLVLENFDGSMAMAAAGYNAGPGRPRRWREGPTLDAAIWAENIPFNETRDYVKRVLSNATIYAQLLGQPGQLDLRSRLGRLIGPAGGTAFDKELP